jgi:anti-sigma factor RsiW
MKHEELKQKLFSLYDGPLTEKERALVEGHLGGCQECREAIDTWKSAASALFPKPAFSEVEEDRFTAAVMARVGKIEAARERSFSYSAKWLVPLLGTAALAIWVFSAFTQSPYVHSNATVGNFLAGDSPEVMVSTWTNVPESAPSFGTMRVSYSGR